jgi:hypothetical protein
MERFKFTSNEDLAAFIERVEDKGAPDLLLQILQSSDVSSRLHSLLDYYKANNSTSKAVVQVTIETSDS